MILCANVGDSKDRWALHLRRHPRKWFGRDLPAFAEARALTDAIHQALLEEPSVVDLDWQFGLAD